MSAHLEITNLLYRYAELMDAGDLEGLGDLFADAVIVLDPAAGIEADSAAMVALWESMVILHDDGTPGTKHVVTNPILEIDEAAGSATCRSYYTVLQQVDDAPLQPVAAGRYHDEFRCIDGTWRFSRRDYSMLDLAGDLSRHLR